ncbi:hypothetical protein BVRB_2g033830 [Beta vulgaris subsp. vulgaris]|nr:hypothetical protein BVRB_2g033830 [Beta vulgaris subsp. vulgaris]
MDDDCIWSLLLRTSGGRTWDERKGEGKGFVEERESEEARVDRKRGVYVCHITLITGLVTTCGVLVTTFGLVLVTTFGPIYCCSYVNRHRWSPESCPCALGLATPTAILVGTSIGERQGLLLRGGDVLERLAGINYMAFDKTGTLTEGKPTVCRGFVGL